MKIIEILEKHPKMNEIVVYRRNMIKNSGGVLQLDNPHFANNRISITGSENTIRFDNKAYARNSKLYINGKNNTICVKMGTVITGNSQIIVKGEDNTIEIGDNCELNNIDLHINGNRNYIKIGNNGSFVYFTVMIERHGNRINIGQKCTFHGRANAQTSLHLDEETSITIGNDCMISNAVHIMSTDSHTVMDMSGKRINKAADISIGDHCWICMRTICMKGAEIGSNSVVGAASIVNKKFEQEHCLIAGNPARIIRNDINWDRERIE